MRRFLTLSFAVLMLITSGCEHRAAGDALVSPPASEPDRTDPPVSSPVGDYPPVIMVDGIIYLLDPAPIPGEVDEGAIIGCTDSYTDAFPSRNGETNFNRDLDMPYARVADGIAVLYENEWRLCVPYNS